MKDGFIKVAAASPIIKVADAEYNASVIIDTMKKADALGVKLLVLPELCLTGCTCGDLFSHRVLLEGARRALARIVEESVFSDMLTLVGLPVAVGSKVYSCAAAVSGGELLGLVPGENRHRAFSLPHEELMEVDMGGCVVPFGCEVLFDCAAIGGLSVAVELGEDMNDIVPPSALHTRAGAVIVAQLAGFAGTIDSTNDALLSLRAQSKRLACGMIMAAPGKGESTTDNVYTGFCAVAENGLILAQDEKYCSMAVSEIDVEHMLVLRRQRGGFDEDVDFCEHVDWICGYADTVLTRSYSKLPNLPARAEDVPAYCKRVLDIQVSGLVKRMEYAHLTHCVIGISGGSDSTLAVMICAEAVKRMGLPSTNVVACTMPCFGTSSRTKNNAIVVSEQLGAEVRVIDITAAVKQHFDDIGHAHDDYSVAFENTQARERTQILFDIANKVNGLNVGTEDLSEFIDGWCTYNGDHTSSYDVNMGLTKTQIRANLRYIAQTTDDEILAKALWDVLDCPITPELLPIFDDQISQKSEDAVGSYALQDFFTFWMLKNGCTPSKVFRLAKQAYGGDFSSEELIRWLRSYCKRLFSQQFKRSCLMDGPSIDSFSVSPRIGMLIPSDGEAALWFADIDQLEESLK